MTTVACTPASRPAQAKAMAALPAEKATIPRARSAADSDAILLVIPRALNEPVYWRCSAFR